jgi:hypothetical protein
MNPSIPGFNYTPQRPREDSMSYIMRLDRMTYMMPAPHRRRAERFIQSEVNRLRDPINNTNSAEEEEVPTTSAEIPKGFKSVPIPRPPDFKMCGVEDEKTGKMINSISGGEFDPERTVFLSDGQCYDYDTLIQMYDTAASNPKKGHIVFVSPFNRQEFNKNDIDVVFTLKKLMRGTKRGTKKSPNKNQQSKKRRGR